MAIGRALVFTFSSIYTCKLIRSQCAMCVTTKFIAVAVHCLPHYYYYYFDWYKFVNNQNGTHTQQKIIEICVITSSCGPYKIPAMEMNRHTCGVNLASVTFKSARKLWICRNDTHSHSGTDITDFRSFFFAVHCLSPIQRVRVNATHTRKR